MAKLRISDVLRELGNHVFAANRASKNRIVELELVPIAVNEPRLGRNCSPEYITMPSASFTGPSGRLSSSSSGARIDATGACW